MASERDRFIAELIAALQENDELSSPAPAAPAVLPTPQAPARQTGSTAARSTLTSSAFSDESDDTDDDADAAAEAAARAVFTGFFRESWASAHRRSSAAFTAAVTGGTSSRAETNAREAYEKLQFDFPQVDDAQLLALAESYRHQSSPENAGRTTTLVLPVTNTLIEGIVYLNEKSASGAGAAGSVGEAIADSAGEARGLLAASVLLLMFERCLLHADDIRTRSLLGKLQVPLPASTKDTTRFGVEELDHSVPPMLNLHAHSVADEGEDEYAEKYASQEDPDDLSQVYEGDFPVAPVQQQQQQQQRSFGSHHQQHMQQQEQFKTSVSFADKLKLIASRTFSSSFTGISTVKWGDWGIDKCLFGIMKQLLLESSDASESQMQQTQQLYGHHAQGEWTRYLYILRDRILRFPNASRSGILTLKDLVELFQPKSASHQQITWSNKKKETTEDSDAEPAIQLPHHLVYRVLAELVLSKEFQQRASQPAQRELASALQTLLPLIIQELQRLGASRQALSEEATRADESDDLILILIQLVHFLLFATPSKRAAVDKLQESGFLRALLTLVPLDPAHAHMTMRSKRFWFTPLVRLIAECALLNGEFAAYVSRVPKFVALLPELMTEFSAEFALVLVALHHHMLHELAVVTILVSEAGVLPDGNGAVLWDVFVCKALFPLACESYLDSMKKLQDAVYFLECVIGALGSLSSQLVGELRASLQRIYPKFADTFVYPTLAVPHSSNNEIVVVREEALVLDGGDQEQEREEEERGQAESLQFMALRNKLRQCTKTILLTSSVPHGAFSTGSSVAYSSSKLD